MAAVSPRISVIMPIYNTAPYLRRALDSVCNQTFRDMEILCINDGSTDESPAILKEYAAKDGRIRLIDHGKNRGYACAMNSGFDAATGETIGIVDSDDAIGIDFYAELWSVYERGGCDIVKGRVVEREVTGRWREHFHNAALRRSQSPFCQWQSAIYRTQLIRKYGLKLSLELPTGQDILFLYQLMGHEPDLGFSDRAIYFYLRNGASMTKSHPEEFYLAANITIAALLKRYLAAYPRESQRLKIFMYIVGRLDFNLNRRFTACDVAPHLPEIKAILADDQFYAPQKSFPLLRQAIETNDIEELRTVLKTVRAQLVAASLREELRRKRA